MISYEVVVTAFNRYTELELTLIGILNQTLKAKKIHLVIDGSNEKIVELGKKYGCQVYSLPHAGFPAIGRNFGRNQCRSEVIAFCDDDDVWAEDKMECQLGFLIKNPKIDMVYTRASYWNGENTFGQVSNFHGKIKLSNLLVKNPCVFSSLVFRNNSKMKYFDERKKIKAWEDYFMLIESTISGMKIEVLEKTAVFYRINSSNKISKKHDPIRDLNQLFIISGRLITSKKPFYIFIAIISSSLRFLRSIIYSKSI
jgi:glycosyltransferase involved in cell wall biosynthesis